MYYRIKEARKAAKLTQRELAEKLGIKVSTLSGYEIGAHDPKSNNLARRHAHWFDVPADEADRERIARNVRSGFGQIVQSRLGHRKHPCYTYKGWTLGDWPRDKDH